MYPALAVAGLLGLLADWQSVDSLRTALPAQARPLAHWRGADAAFLAASVPGKGVWSVVRLEGGKTEVRFDGSLRAGTELRRVSSLDLEGVIAGAAVVLFYTEARLASSAISFDTGKLDVPKLRFIVTGVAPGMWEVWRNGWVVDPGVPVRKGEALLSFEERPGSYFVRRLQ